MSAFIIEQEGSIKEVFAYDRPLSEASYQALVEYARANYGPDAILRSMTEQEEANFVLHGPEFFKEKPEP